MHAAGSCQLLLMMRAHGADGVRTAKNAGSI
jgi:hypothetical protein